MEKGKPSASLNEDNGIDDENEDDYVKHEPTQKIIKLCPACNLMHELNFDNEDDRKLCKKCVDRLTAAGSGNRKNFWK